MRLGRTLGWAASITVLGLAGARGMEAGPPLPRGLPADLRELLVPTENPAPARGQAYILSTRKGVALEPGKH